MPGGSARKHQIPGLLGHRTSPHWIFFLWGMWRTSSTSSKTIIFTSWGLHKGCCDYSNPQYASKHVDRGQISFGYPFCHHRSPHLNIFRDIIFKKFESVPLSCCKLDVRVMNRSEIYFFFGWGGGRPIIWKSCTSSYYKVYSFWYLLIYEVLGTLLLILKQNFSFDHVESVEFIVCEYWCHMTQLFL
jgi:hypothetical protein